MKARGMPDAAPRQRGHCPQGRGRLPLRDTQSPRDAVTRPAPTTRALLGAHVSTRRAPPASPASGGRCPGPSGGRLGGLPAPAAEQNADSADALPRRPGLGARRRQTRRSLNPHLKFSRASSRKVTLKHTHAGRKEELKVAPRSRFRI